MDPSTPSEPPTRPTAGGTARPRRAARALRIAAVVLVGLLAVYLLLAWLAFEPLLRWALPRLAQQHGAHQLSFQQARFDPWRLVAEVQGLDLRHPDGQPMLQLERLVVDLDAASPFQRAWVIERLQITAPVLHLALQADGRPDWMDLLDSLAGPAPPADAPAAAPARWRLRRLLIEHGQLALADRSQGRDVQLRVDPLDLDASDLSTLPESPGQHRLSARLADAGTLRWQGQLGLNPLAARGELALDGLPLQRLWPYLSPALAIAPPKGLAALKFSYHLSKPAAQLVLQLDQVDLQLTGLVLGGAGAAAPAIALDRVSVTGGRLALPAQEASIAAIDVGPGRIAVSRDAAGRFDLAAWLRPASPAAAPQPAGAAASAPVPPWRLAVDKLRADGLALQFDDRSLAAPLSARADRLRLGVGLQAEFDGAAPEVRLQQLGAELEGLRLSSAGLAQPWFELDRLALADGRLSARGREVALGAVTLTGGRLRAERTAQGQLPLVQALQPLAAAAAPKATTAAPAPSAPWRYRADRVQLRQFALALREASVAPPTEFKLLDLQAEVQGLTQDLQRALPVTLDLRVASGGRLQAVGQLVPGAPSLDLKLALDGLSLLPAQAYVAQATTLVLARGTAGSHGRLRWQPERWRYDGALDLGPLQVDEAATGERLLSWTRLSTPDLALTPAGLRIGELTAEGLGAKLTVFKDRTLNLARILRPPTAVPAPAGRAPAPAPAPAPTDPFDIDIGQVRIKQGTLDFADLSLALPFGARIHGMNGQLVGLQRRGDAPAQLELEGKVDEFGLARAAGGLRLFDPTAFTDIKVEFRNVEMTTLTPYSATFAGRRIESGKLSLDLEYKVKDRQLAGENRIVMDRLTLGERVDSPGASNLPLDLALAILQDADGRIDLGLPVSGSLDDPQFSYGQIVWKALVNVLTKIVTAPFRALGALLGGGEQTLDRIGFDVGRSVLLPPEREALKSLAEALAKRPGLSVTVQAGYDPEADAAALRQQALRFAVAKQRGAALAPDEEPGPINTAEPATRTALAQLFTQRFGAAALAELMQRQAPATPPGPTPPASAAVLSPGGDVPALLLQRLLAAEAVDDARLLRLAGDRASAIQAELVARQVDAARVRTEPPAARAASDRRVPAVLGVAVAAATPAAQAASSGAPVPTDRR